MIRTTQPVQAFLRRSQNGITLVELSITVAIISIAFLAAVSAFTGVARSILVNKYRSLATNLAQEKVESLKHLSYYRLVVTNEIDISEETDLHNKTYRYYNGSLEPYAEEDVIVGGASYTRRTLVEKVAKGLGNDLVTQFSTISDTGLKRVTVNVIWKNERGEPRRVELLNLRENPRRVFFDAAFTGEVDGLDINGVNLDKIREVRVGTFENHSYFGFTDPPQPGIYSFNVTPGTYTLRATRRGFFPRESEPTYIGPGETIEIDFEASGPFAIGQLVEMSSGSVQGYVLTRDHLVISEVVTKWNPVTDLEYVELYNPTTSPITISPATFDLRLVDNVGNAPSIDYTIVNKDNDPAPVVPGDFPLSPLISTTIPPNGYFLFLGMNVDNGWTTLTPNGLRADATYYILGGEPNLSDAQPAGAAIWRKGVAAGIPFEIWLASVAWGSSLGGCNAPAQGAEPLGVGINLGCVCPCGVDAGNSLERKAFLTSTPVDMAPAGINELEGNGWDTHVNPDDWLYHNPGVLSPQNNSSVEISTGGTPIANAFVIASDGLSLSALSAPDGSFNLTEISTGTWIISASIGSFHEEFLIDIPGQVHISTNMYLITPSTVGYITGFVKEPPPPANQEIPGLLMEAGGYQTLTDINGFYRLSLPPGVYDVVANPEQENPEFFTVRELAVDVQLGQLISGLNFDVPNGGSISGFVGVTTVDGLPAVPISIRDQASDLELYFGITDDDGNFSVPVTTRPGGSFYRVEAVVDVGEVVTPDVTEATVAVAVVGGLIENVNIPPGNPDVFIGTFTVSAAYARIKGKVNVGSDGEVKTGVIIMAVLNGIAVSMSSPPDIDDALRTGSDLYYLTSSRADGTYRIDVLGFPGGVTYDIYVFPANSRSPSK